MEPKEFCQQGNTLQAKFDVKHETSTNSVSKCSPEYVLCGLTTFQVKINVTRTPYAQRTSNSDFKGSVLIRFEKLQEDDEMIYMIKLSSNEFNIKNHFYLSDDSSWHEIYEYNKVVECTFMFTFDIEIAMDLCHETSLFSALYEDTELTDFELRGEDGSVHMHRIFLAALSPVLRTMLNGKWKETTEGRVEMAGTTKQTLEHLKDYIYLRKLPEIGLKKLLELASYYMMSDLVQLCSVKLLTNLTSENAFDLMQLACKYKLKRLFLGIQHNVQAGVIKANDMQKCVEIDWI